MIERTDLVVDTDASLVGWAAASATFSPDRVYRYALTRTWNPGGPVVAFVMLNPSTADAFRSDPTIRRCLGFARAWACGGLAVCNLFGLRATDPSALRGHPDPVGPDADLVLADILGAGRVSHVIAAWGVHGTHLDRDRQVAALLARTGHPLYCLGTTAAGHPRHPLYVRADAPLVPFRPPARPA